jgi:hypothetical protein
MLFGTARQYDQSIGGRHLFHDVQAISRARYEAQIYANNARVLGHVLSREVTHRAAIEDGRHVPGRAPDHGPANQPDYAPAERPAYETGVHGEIPRHPHL